MERREIDIDRVVDYKAEYWAYVKKPKISGDCLTGLCPFHDDHNNSFSVDLKSGKWHCLTEDTGGNFISFWAQIHGIDTKEAYKQILERYNLADDPQQQKPKGSGLGGFTLADYAAAKRLPEEWLKAECKMTTVKDRYYGVDFIRIPYMGEDGQEVTFRKRFARKQFRWKKGSAGKINLYGEWRLPTIRKDGRVILAEGESDSQSLWQMGLPALGVPGASMFKPAYCTQLCGLTLYLHIEKDRGGETFLAKTLQSLRDGGFEGKVYRFSCGDVAGCKDPSDIWIKFGKDAGKKRIADLMKNATEIDITAEDVPAVIEGAPVNLRQPEGWVYSESGISKIDEKTYEPKMICRTPIVLTQRLKSLDTGDEKIEVAFMRDGIWQKLICNRSQIFTARGITTLADSGCTITSENAKYVVQFLSALESENIDILGKADATGTFGWQPGGRFIPGIEKGIVMDVDPSQRGMVAAYCKQGNLDGWVKTMAPHRERDKFRFILAASFAAPLLRIIKQRIFFVYNWGGSKGGKTAALKAALSAWGDPERLMVNFNTTQVGLERTAAFYCDLPLGIDERQLAGRNQESLERIIYMIASGTGKIRGAKSGGIQALQTWRTVALATGEEPLSTETTQTGVSTRVLEVYGGPFDDEKSASLMHQQSPLNCGHAGPEFVNLIVSLEEWKICEMYDEMVKYVSGVANGKSGSHVSGIAAVALADAMIDSWFFQKLKWGGLNSEKNSEILPESLERAKQMAKAILEEQMSEDVGDVNENATQFVVDWVQSNAGQFGTQAVGTCFGDTAQDGELVYIYPSLLQQALTKAGYSSRKTLKYMADMGYIASTDRKDNNGKTYTMVRRFNGRLSRFVELRLGAITQEKNGGTSYVQQSLDEWMELPPGAEDDLPFV